MKKFFLISVAAGCLLAYALTAWALSSKAAAEYTLKVIAPLVALHTIVAEVVLWLIFFTVMSLGTYFIANTLILINNNRRYRFLAALEDSQKNAGEKLLETAALENVKSSERRLVLFGAIIVFFVILCFILSAYLYLAPSILEKMWSVIYYGVSLLAVLTIIYAVAFVVEKIKYRSLPKGELEAARLYGNIQTIKNRLKLFIIAIMLLVLIYLALLVAIAKGVQEASS